MEVKGHFWWFWWLDLRRSRGNDLPPTTRDWVEAQRGQVWFKRLNNRPGLIIWRKKKKHKNTSDGRHLPRSRLQKLREKRTNRSREFTAAQNGSVLFCSPKTRLSRLRPAEERLPSMEEKVEKINLWRFSLSFWSLIPSKEPASGASVTSAPPAFLTSCPLWAPPPWIHRQWGEQLELKPKQTFSLFWLLIFSLSKTRKSLTSSNHIVLFCLLFLFFSSSTSAGGNTKSCAWTVSHFDILFFNFFF